MSGHQKKLPFSPTTIITIGAAAFAAVVLLGGTPRLGLWDPWEMNHSAVAWRMSGKPAVLVIEGGGSNRIASALDNDSWTIDTTGSEGSAARGLDTLRDKTSDRIFAAVVFDPSALAPEIGASTPDPGAIKTVANALRSAASRNVSTSFILVPDSGIDGAFLKTSVLAAASGGENESSADLEAALSVVTLEGGSAALRDSVDRAAAAFKSTAQFKSGGRTMLMPPLEPWVTSLWFNLFGYNEFAARLTGVLFAILTLVLLLLGSRRFFGERVPATAVFILTTSMIFYGTARFVGAGMPEVFFLALWAVSFAHIVTSEETSPQTRRGRLTWWVLMISSVALSWLAGGMTAISIVAASAGAWFVMSPNRRHLPAVLTIFGMLGLAAVITFMPESAWFRQFRFTAATFAGGISTDYRTFDFVIKEIGFGFFPWSAFIPVAVWMAVSSREEVRPGRLLLLAWAVVPMITSMIFIRPFGQSAYLGVPALAMLTALFFDEFSDEEQDGTLAARIFGFFAIGLFLVMMKDMTKSPAPLVTFLTTDPMFGKPGQGDGGFPSTVFIPTTGKLMLALMLLSMLSVAARISDIAKTVQTFLAGRRVFIAAMAIMAGLILIDIIVFTALKWRSLRSERAGQELLRIFLTGPDIAGLYLLTALVAILHWWGGIWKHVSARLGTARSDAAVAALYAFQTTKVQRPVFIICAAGFTMVQVFGVIPDLTHHLSQKHIVDTWKEAAAREPGQLFRHGSFSGKGTEDSNFYTANIEEKASRSEVTKLLADKSKRTFFLVPTRQFSEINSAWRDLTGEKGLPVLDDRSSRIVLVASKLADGETDRNWLSRATLTQSEFESLKDVERKIVNFDNSIELVGFSITPQALTRGTKPVLKTYYRVLKKISKSYRVFLHVDKVGSSTRIHGDHWILNLVPESEDQDDCLGCYATNHWKKGDVIVDSYTLDVPIGSPAGDYDVWMGLYLPGGGRMKVVSFDEDKIRHDGSERVRIGRMTVR